MQILKEAQISARDLERFVPLLGETAVAEARAMAGKVRDALAGGVLWNVNSTAVGGGVAEMLQPLLGYTRGLGIDTRWLVIRGGPAFFKITKRLHHALHGSPGDGSPLGDAERALYEETLRPNIEELLGRVRAGDAVILHDPQTAGMAPALRRAGARVIWRCHIGDDRPSTEATRGWAFLDPYLADVKDLIFSRRAYVPELLDGARVAIIPPSIDAFSAKNAELDELTVRGILVHTGLVEGPAPTSAHREFSRGDGTPGRVERGADVVRLGRAPSWDAPLVVQVSRWDPLKDMEGVMRGFARAAGAGEAHLVLAGPNVKGVADDPEAPAVFDAVLEAWRGLPHGIRRRVHLVCLPVADIEENAVIVNALQRHAAIVVQKSLREGFGLTVTEAMWKARSVVASAVGGIQDQIEDGESGLLLRDPADVMALAAALDRLLGDPAARARLGANAHERVRRDFLGVRHLLQYGRLLAGD